MAHQKVLVTLIICIGIIGSVFVVSKIGNNSPEATDKKNIQDLLSTIDKAPEADTDGDGLKDWEESLIGTNPNIKDTDGDGTSDGDEVAVGRDPKKAGPNDKASTETSPLVIDSMETEENTLTAQVSRNFFGQYLLAKKGGQEITPEKALEIAESVMENIPVESNAKQYEIKDITIVPETVASKAAYLEEFIRILKANPSKPNENEIQIITKAIESQNVDDIKKLDSIILSYKNITAETLRIPVPKSLVPDHMIYLNALSSVYTDISEMRQVLDDPMRGYIGYAHYQKDALVLKIGYEAIQAYFGYNQEL